MKTIKVNLYKYEELDLTAKEMALNYFRENNEYEFLDEFMRCEFAEQLDTHGIKYAEFPELYHFLSPSQGDGVSFEGNVEYKGKNYRITSNGTHYPHKYTMIIEGETPEDDITEFKEIAYKICDHLEEYGYAHIEYEDSEEGIKEECDANDRLFLKNGTYWCDMDGMEGGINDE